MDPYLGEIRLMPYMFAPKGWEYCEGQMMQIMQYQALFSLLGTNFGGDGRTTFALPNLSSPASGVKYVIATEGVYPMRP